MRKDQEETFNNDLANGFALRKRVVGEGSERYVFLFSEAKVTSITRETLVGTDTVTAVQSMIGERLVAKCSRFDRDKDDLEYHNMFVRKHYEARDLAEEFNKRLDAAEDTKTIPRVRCVSWSVGAVLAQLLCAFHYYLLALASARTWPSPSTASPWWRTRRS